MVTDTFKKDKIMFEKFNLKENPFRTVPALGNDVVWAGFSAIKKKFEKRIKKSIRIQNSSIVLNWGEYGSGKTHAARYFSKIEILQELCNDTGKSIPLSIVINLPKGKNAVGELYLHILDKLDFNKIFVNLHKYVNLDTYIDSVTDNVFIKNVLRTFVKASINEQLEDSSYHVEDVINYLYGRRNTKLLEQIGLPRYLTSDSDYIDFLSAFFSLITSDPINGYSCVIIWIDEFEDIVMQSASVVTVINSFIRGVMDKAPSNVLMFINLTLTAFADKTDLSSYLQDAVRSRVKEQIEFPLPSQNEFMEYLSDLLSQFRITETQDVYMPFKTDMLDQLISDLGNVSIRRFNEALSLLLETADIEDVNEVNMNFYIENKSDIIGIDWKN